MTYSNDNLKAEDVAEILRVSKNTVYSLAKEGNLGSYHIGRKLRFTRSDVEEYITRSRGHNPRVGQSAHSSSNHVEHTSSLGHPPPNESSALRRIDDSFILAGSDMTLDILAHYLSTSNIPCYRRHETDYQNLIDMYFERIDAAAISLWDSSSDSYNIPYIKRMLPGVPVAVFHIAHYEQGFLVKRGNPCGIRSWVDLLEPSIRLANREKGSASRILLDEQLRLLEATPHTITGYTKEINNEIVQATLIAKKSADVGIGREKLYHQIPGIDFLPQKTEHLALVVAKKPKNETYIRTIAACLNSKVFQHELANMVGHNFDRLGDCLYET